MKLTREEYHLLLWAVDEARLWRGQYVGHPDAGYTLAMFDERMKKTYAVLRKYSPWVKKK